MQRTMTQEPVRCRAYFQQQQRRRSSARCLVQKVQDIFSKHLICKTCTCRGNGRPVKPRYWLLQPSLLNWRCRPCNKRCVLSSRVKGGLNVGKDASCASRGLSAFLHPTCSQFNLCFPHLVDGGGLLIDKVSERRKGFSFLAHSLLLSETRMGGRRKTTIARQHVIRMAVFHTRVICYFFNGLHVSHHGRVFRD